MEILSTVMDPEIPVISVVDLGIIHQVNLKDDELYVEVLPTYSGCPATDYIPVLIQKTLSEHGYRKVNVSNVLDPDWSSDRITGEGLRKLADYGIAPPSRNSSPECPRCNAQDVVLTSEFGSTPCKSLYQCRQCLEPFEYFKCH
ncbi:MAG: phenylacetate-CoA oxygenase subunit PaaJ [Saprospiraceae bacterium]|nr:phenylacetate-CoA oxygenase subunit PaaJ [Saprospiraceae bacterium]